jgi:hypothetical protein
MTYVCAHVNLPAGFGVTFFGKVCDPGVKLMRVHLPHVGIDRM